ncbi:MAG: hypothetical protein ACM3S1_05965 [Hyphomicrobiales bacterium]
MTTRTFVDLCLAGEVDTDEIELFIRDWHEGQDTRSLAEFLGFSDEEYALWVEKPAILPAILASRRSGSSLREAVEAVAGSTAAVGAPNSDAADDLLVWIRERGA